MITEDGQEVSTVHDALRRSMWNNQKESLEVFQGRARRDHIKLAMEICEANGSSLSAYLRQCIDDLCADYGAIPKIG